MSDYERELARLFWRWQAALCLVPGEPAVALAWDRYVGALLSGPRL